MSMLKERSCRIIELFVSIFLMQKIFQVLDVVILCWLSTSTRSYTYIVESWTTLRVTFAPCLVSHPNLRPFITFLGVSLACLLMALVGFGKILKQVGVSTIWRAKEPWQE
ncbi:hypothetical protein S83_040125 [Arachis hypogaea]